MHGTDIFCSLIQHILFFRNETMIRTTTTKNHVKEASNTHLPLLEEPKKWGVRKRDREPQDDTTNNNKKKAKKEAFMKKKTSLILPIATIGCS